MTDAITDTLMIALFLAMLGLSLYVMAWIVGVML